VDTVSIPNELLIHLRRAKDHADRSFAEPLDLDRLSAEARVSKYHFVRTFAAAYGETPMRYLARRRMERARDLLRATNLTVTEVCFLVGYSSLGTFSARFSELVGMSPTEYQRSEEARSSDHIPGCYVFMLGPFSNSAIREKRPSGDPS
jgi:AraC-like DNA-binding protein